MGRTETSKPTLWILVLVADANREVDRFEIVIHPTQPNRRPNRDPLALDNSHFRQVRVGGT